MNMSKLSLLERREIEALIAAPLMKGYARELGFERSVEVATGVIQGLARKAGEEMAERSGSNSMADLRRVIPKYWAKDGALALTILEQTDNTLIFHVTRCRYAETYDRLGVRDLGYCLSCSRDDAFAEGFNPRIRLTRTQTIMEGAPFCDFHFELI